jgi:drug/metabolite transporter (DMT)-like permease
VPLALGLGIGLAAVSTASVLIRFALREGAPPLAIAAYRLTLATLILAPVALGRCRQELRALRLRDWLLVLASGVSLGVHFATWVSSLAYTSVASSVVLVTTSPLFVALFAALFLRERLSPGVLAGMAIALAGGVVVALSDRASGGSSSAPLPTAMLGNGLALAGAVAAGVYLSIGRGLRPRMSLQLYIFLTYGTAAVTVDLALAAARIPAAGYNWHACMWMTLLALVPQLIGHSSFNWALRYLPATYVSVTTLGEPIGSTLLALALLSEVPSVQKIVGGALILAGILAASWPVRPKEAAKS